ncbi:chemotaxis protein CheW [Desulfopila sp. IMCC35008]|uniref:chemotaxis protein CheW n=1 Tax=Desulfopila sp. IMCC35008 TaxID=2653858 RepID=UPI0013D40BCC|nr:chemotaxis protein CheW [Desulfopila sp. IMCC35008]
MVREKLFASFLLDEREGLEIALQAESVMEATPIHGRIMPLPGGVDFLEGIMHLRDETIPVINMKKRLGLADCAYRDDAKVAVVSLYNQQFGLLMDDIRDVFRADAEAVVPLGAALQTEDRIISSLIHLERGKRVAELLDLKKLFLRGVEELENSLGPASREGEKKQVSRSRFVVVTCNGQEYGIPVECAQEITFLTEIDEMFRSGILDGALELRGRTIPVINSSHLLNGKRTGESDHAETSRVLVLAQDDCAFGMIVEDVLEILSVPDNEILSLPPGQDENITGLYARPSGKSVMLLNMENLVCNEIDEIKSMSRIKNGSSFVVDPAGDTARSTHHLITENCYLVFSIVKNYAIELKDVYEIIEADEVMRVPGDSGFRSGVINLRGRVVPVVNLRGFYGYPQRGGDNVQRRLIICSGHHHTVALEVDQVVTIYKQETFHTTPSLNPQLAEKKDTLDRLIEFDNGTGVVEHVLVVNTYNLVRNHLEYGIGSEEPVQPS